MIKESQLGKDLQTLRKVIWKYYPNIGISSASIEKELYVYIENKNENYYLPFIKNINNNCIKIYPARRININNVVYECKILR
jgi:hypothetical protein